ncbi:MAG: hypothetical protein U0469_00680 [Candidatus Paceibacterota bacterium]|jgi:uncharacterized membrane protein YuzA (DUF378 family)
MAHLAKILLIIGGLELGILGVGKLINSEKDLNIIELFRNFHPLLPTILYLLIGVSAFVLIFKKD